MDARRSHEQMDTQLMLLIAAMVSLILLVSLVVGLVTSHRRRVRLRFNRRVNATITHTQLEASSLSCWWTITAEWTDPQSGHHYYFRSPHLHSNPRHRLGKQIAVRFNATRPQDYLMEL